MTTAVSKYKRDMTVAMVLYAGAIFGVNLGFADSDLPLAVMIPISLIPMLPIVLVLRAVLVFSRSWDELQKRIVGESLAIAFLIVGGGTFAYGFMEGVGLPALPTIWIFPAMMLTYGIASAFVSGRYK
ncbi:MAG: hypothetical protein EP335_06015 [Alphaproteobacteria bacterium]|nr:MAG: hypothetical protein EP335_06015 [Alphaproteobacteria bacterium]